VLVGFITGDSARRSYPLGFKNVDCFDVEFHGLRMGGSIRVTGVNGCKAEIPHKYFIMLKLQPVVTEC